MRDVRIHVERMNLLLLFNVILDDEMSMKYLHGEKKLKKEKNNIHGTLSGKYSIYIYLRACSSPI